METYGRFEWLTIPETESVWVEEEDNDTPVYMARTCRNCGWIDSDERFEGSNVSTGSCKCFRCGFRWDLSEEINAFFEKEEINVPPSKIERKTDNLKDFFRNNSPDAPELFPDYVRQIESTLCKDTGQFISLDRINVSLLSHQLTTVKKVISKMRGRAILADEVGLGKTIEAGMIIKELLARGLISRVLILTPAGLTCQWTGELENKFNEAFSDRLKSIHAETSHKLILSYDTAKRRPQLQSVDWDLVVLDEAHLVKNRSTLVSKFVHNLNCRFMIALTATPVQNSLADLFTLVDIVKPGTLGTIRTFNKNFVSPADHRKVILEKKHILKESLSEVMVRNRRDSCGLKLPKRKAAIYYINKNHLESELYQKLSDSIRQMFIKKKNASKKRGIFAIRLLMLQRSLTSTPAAAAKGLRTLAADKDISASQKSFFGKLAQTVSNIHAPSKIEALKEIIDHFKGRRFIVFTEFVSSLKQIRHHLETHGATVFSICGKEPVAKRERALSAFAATLGSVLVATETGGVGLNLQKCSHLVNFDLPWNPMRIEQRIGRIDRIGQTKDLYIFNLVFKDCIEEHVVEILGKKMRMFEMVMGETRSVLGFMDQNKSLEQLIGDIWLSNTKDCEMESAFWDLGEKVKKAKDSYDKNKMINARLPVKEAI